MNIAELIQKMHNASTEAEKEKVANDIRKEFSSLSKAEKSIVQKEFLNSWDNKLAELENLSLRPDRS